MEINYDPKTVEGFGEEWEKFDQSYLAEEELFETYKLYFDLFPWNVIGKNSVGFDLGCGSGRWAKFVAPKVGQLYCVDASRKALEVAKKNLAAMNNCIFLRASVDELPLEDKSMDFGYSLGVLHHVPDTIGGIKSCVNKLKSGAPFLLYLYYAFDNRPKWFKAIWQITDPVRRYISNQPFPSRYRLSQLIAATVYYPLSRLSLLLERLGYNVDRIPLAAYRKKSFYTMRTDALDRFGTRLEKRFTSEEIQWMMEEAGLRKISFSDSCFWCAIGYKE